MTRAQKADINAVRSACTQALSDAMSHPDVLNLRRIRNESNTDAIWRRRAKIAELAVESVVERGLDRDVAVTAVPRVFEEICQGVAPDMNQLVVV